jgi:hypothetical protein
LNESDNIHFTTLYNFQYDHDLDYNNWGWVDFRDAWQQIAAEEDDDYAWRVIYDLWRMRAGEVEISLESMYDDDDEDDDEYDDEETE